MKRIRRRRRSIKGTFKEQYGGFCGWSEINKVLKSLKDPRHKKLLVGQIMTGTTITTLKNPTEKIFNGLFITGGRVNELNTLKKRQVRFNEPGNYIWIRSMYVEKQRDIKRDEMNKPIPKLDENGERRFTSQGLPIFETESKPAYRTFPIRRDNPFVSVFKEYVESFKDPEALLYDYTAGQMYYRLAMIDNRIPEGVSKAKWSNADYIGPWWPHRVRAERACQLIRDHDYNTFRLKRWFGWASLAMPELYGDIVPKDLTQTMGELKEWL